MNKKLFLAGVALLAAIGFTSCNSDMPIDSSNPSGIAPTVVGHEVGIDYDWKAIVKDYAQLQDFWAKDKDAVKTLLANSGANTVNVFIGVANYELKGEDIVLPDFWQTGLTNGKVVNITFAGDFKNADFERADIIQNGAAATKYPVKINTHINLKGAEVNFTFDVEQFDLHLTSRDARSTLSGDFTIGYMLADADVTKNDAVELKSGTVEGVDLQSTGKFKGTYDGVWTKMNESFEVASNGIKLVKAPYNVVPGAKNVYVESDAKVDTWYQPNTSTNSQYKLGTVKFVQKAGTNATLTLNGTHNGGFVGQDAIEKIEGFNKANCFVNTVNKAKAFENIDEVEKVSVNGTATLTKDIFTDVEFLNTISFTTKKISEFDYVTFNALNITVHDNNQALTFNTVNFKNAVSLLSGIYSGDVTGYSETLYQWVIDIDGTSGHFEKVDDNNPILDANKDKATVEWDKSDIDYNPASKLFIRPAGSEASADDLAAVNNSYLVLIYSYDYDGTTYIPEGTDVNLNSCKFKEPSNGNMNTTLTALNNIWGNKILWDEQCWYTVYVDGAKYNWKKATSGTSISTVKFVLVPAAE